MLHVGWRLGWTVPFPFSIVVNSGNGFEIRARLRIRAAFAQRRKINSMIGFEIRQHLRIRVAYDGSAIEEFQVWI